MTHPEESEIHRLILSLLEFEIEPEDALLPEGLEKSQQSVLGSQEQILLIEISTCEICADLYRALCLEELGPDHPSSVDTQHLELTPPNPPVSESDPETDDSPGAWSKSEDLSPNPAELTLLTADGRFLVRIFDDQTKGATAILLSLEPESSEEVCIRIEGKEYVFGETTMIRLPRFPASTMSLVVRGDSGTG